MKPEWTFHSMRVLNKKLGQNLILNKSQQVYSHQLTLSVFSRSANSAVNEDAVG